MSKVARQDLRACVRARVIQAGKAGEAARKRIEEVALEAIDTVEDILQTGDPHEQAEAAPKRGWPMRRDSAAPDRA